jgi:hypothetical protein
VVVDVVDPSGRTLESIDGPAGSEAVFLLADRAGAWTLVRPFAPEAAGRYRI